MLLQSVKICFLIFQMKITVSNKKRIKLAKEHIPQVNVFVAVKSNQDYHRYTNEDLHEKHYINVLPNK